MCSIDNKIHEFVIRNQDINISYKTLYNKHNEEAGKIIINSATKATSKLIITNQGNGDSVDAPDSIINWHSHPIFCYLGEKTVWGWPSGEDMRETLIFGLRGSGCHIVPSVEGIYSIQPNPCVLSTLINIDNIINRNDYPKLANKVSYDDWGSFLRGIIILAIEIYFKSTHVFRTFEYIQQYPKTTPKDFIDFVNSFKLENMFKSTEIDGCGDISCNKFQEFENKRVSKINFKNYLNKYENDAIVHLVHKNGNSNETKYKLCDLLKYDVENLLKKMILGLDCPFPIQELHYGKLFLMKFYENDVKINNNWYTYCNLDYKSQWTFLNYANSLKIKNPKIIKKSNNNPIKFYMFKISGKCDHNHLKQHISNFSTSNKLKHNFGNKKIEIYGSKKCPYCIKAIDKANDNNINLTVHYFGTIKEAIDEASKKAGKNINTIPAYFLNGIYSDSPLF